MVQGVLILKGDMLMYVKTVGIKYVSGFKCCHSVLVGKCFFMNMEICHCQ